MSVPLFNYLKKRAQVEYVKLGTDDPNIIAERADASLQLMLRTLRLAFIDDVKSGVFEISSLLPPTGEGIPNWPNTVVRPPFENCWFEYEHPLCGRSCRVGFCVSYDPKLPLYCTGILAHFSGCQTYPETAKGAAVVEGIPAILNIPLDDAFHCAWTGAIVHVIPESVERLSRQAAITQDKAQEQIILSLQQCSRLPGFALGLLNCKNVSTVDVEPSAKLNKACERRGKPTHFKYKTLQVTPSAARAVRGEPGQPTGIGTALHVQRGHFKTFDEKPLFGSVKGTFWWEPNVRGKAVNGVVKKTYELEKEPEP